ncbi:MAG: DUF1566 domain-containing protein [Paludibacteraceae bacterium]|nr:DUF1566 domain-containing protein [Paludibacteraceae bacterium]
MKRTLFFGISAAVLSFAALAFVACEGKNGGNSIVRYAGKVVYAGTSTPFPNLEVKVTNGDKIHCLEHTNAEGQFVLTVRIDDINGDYYVLAGDSTCLPKRVNLPGFGQEQFDLGTIEVEGPSLPVVTTADVGNITDETAACGGNVTSDGRSSVTARGVCWAKTEYPTVNDAHTTNGTGKGEFQSHMTNLEAGTTYYVRAYATNRMGTAYGEQLTFSSLTGLPQVTTDGVTKISATSATCGGSVAANSGYSVLARGICWSDKTATPTISNEHTEEVATTGHFTSLMIGLERNTTYYVRAYAVNEKGTNYGETKTFTTLNGLPVVTTAKVTNIKTTTATCGGNVTDNGGYAITARGICWSSTISTPTTENSHTNEVADNGTFSSLMTDLKASTTYYVRAYATNEVGTSYGDCQVFTSGNGMPVVTTTAITKSGSSFLSGGYISDDGGSAVTARGICYGSFPHPDLSSTYKHTSDGTGTGYYTSVINSSGLIYVRAYATNANGTTYGNEISIDLSYLSLPTFVFNNKTYRVAPTASSTMTLENAINYCEGLTLYGYSDWKLPTKEELYQMYALRAEIGGFITYSTYSYWSSSYSSYSSYYYVDIINGEVRSLTTSNKCYVRPIRIEK